MYYGSRIFENTIERPDFRAFFREWYRGIIAVGRKKFENRGIK